MELKKRHDLMRKKVERTLKDMVNECTVFVGVKASGAVTATFCVRRAKFVAEARNGLLVIPAAIASKRVGGIV